MNEVFLKVHKDAKHTLVAVCDSDLIGETFRDGKLKLEVKEDFYRGMPSSVSDALLAVDQADIANLVGDLIVDAAIKERLVDPSAVLRISGVPHVQIVKL